MMPILTNKKIKDRSSRTTPRLKLKLKLAILFSAVISMALSFMGLINFQNARQIIIHNKVNELNIIADYKVKEIMGFFVEWEKVIRVTQNRHSIINNFPVLSRYFLQPNQPEYQQAKNILDNQMNALLKAWDFHNILLLNPQGEIIYEFNDEANLGQKFVDPSHAALGEGQIDIYFSEVIFNYTPSLPYSILMTGPLYDPAGRFLGQLIFEVDMAPIYELIHNTHGLGKTGETVVGRQEHDHALLIHPTKHDPHAAFQRKIYYHDTYGIPMQQATQGQSGSGLSLDYNGEPIIASWHPLYFGHQHWGLVTKIDQKEAFYSIHRLKNNFIIMYFLVLVFAIGIAFASAISITRPLEQLTQSAFAIAQGKLNTRVQGVDTNDELGDLAESFNHMAATVQETTVSRDELSKEIQQRNQIENVLRQSEERYRSLFNSIDEGFCIIEVIFNDEDRPIDYRFLQVNPSFEKQTGLKDAQGKRMLELAPQHEKHWFEIYGNVALTGRPIRFENSAEQLHRWFDVYAFRFGAPQNRQVGILFNDITQRRRVEKDLEQSNQELERFNSMAVGREERMIELKRQINLLSKTLGQKPLYDLSFLDEKEDAP